MAETEKVFQVRFLRYAYSHFDRNFPAQWVTWQMSAPTGKEALRRVKAKIRRGEQYRQLNQGRVTINLTNAPRDFSPSLGDGVSTGFFMEKHDVYRK